jgi:hypothetical protein
MVAAMFEGGPLDGITLRLPRGSWPQVAWAHGACGGVYAYNGFLSSECFLIAEWERSFKGVEREPTIYYTWKGEVGDETEEAEADRSDLREPSVQEPIEREPEGSLLDGLLPG